MVKMYDSWVAYHKTLSRRNLQRIYGRAHKSWDKFNEYDSQKLRCVTQTSERRRLKDKSVAPAWRLAKNIYKLREKDKATFFFSPTDEWSMLAVSTIKPEEREFVVDSGASMHMVNKKDLNSAELKTVTVSKSPTTVVTANGQVQTKDEATVYV